MAWQRDPISSGWPGPGTGGRPATMAGSSSRTARSSAAPDSGLAEGKQRLIRQPRGRGAAQAVDPDADESAGLDRVERHLVETARGEPGPQVRGEVGRSPVAG